jgi:hypothetical protein
MGAYTGFGASEEDCHLRAITFFRHIEWRCSTLSYHRIDNLLTAVYTSDVYRDLVALGLEKRPVNGVCAYGCWRRWGRILAAVFGVR